MSAKIIGIEVGSSTLKMSVVKKGVVRRMAVERMPDNMVREGRIVSKPAMTDFVKKFMKKYKISGSDCALVLPSKLVVALRVTMPEMSMDELRLNLPYEFRDYVGKDASHYDFDYIVNSVSGGTMDLYAAAVRTEAVEEYYEVFRKAGMILRTAMPVEMAWLNIVEEAKNAPRKLAIVDIGHHTTRVSFFVGGNYIMGKDIDLGGQLLDETIASVHAMDPNMGRLHKEANLNDVQGNERLNDAYNTLAMEVMKAINFYNFSQTAQNEMLTDVYICGGTSFVAPLRAAISNATGMQLHPVGELLDLGNTEKKLAVSCALSAGAALQYQ